MILKKENGIYFIEESDSEILSKYSLYRKNITIMLEKLKKKLKDERKNDKEIDKKIKNLVILLHDVETYLKDIWEEFWMNIDKYIIDIKEQMDLEKNDIHEVLMKIDDICINIIDNMHKETGELNDLENDLNKLKKESLEYYLFDSNEDIFSLLKSKTDREILMYSTESLNALERKINDKKRNIRSLEDLKKQVSSIKTTVKTIIEYQNFINGTI